MTKDNESIRSRKPVGALSHLFKTASRLPDYSVQAEPVIAAFAEIAAGTVAADTVAFAAAAGTAAFAAAAFAPAAAGTGIAVLAAASAAVGRHPVAVLQLPFPD